FVYDPLYPVPTEGGGNLKIKAGPYDQRSVENRSDVLIFTSPVLSEPYEATGPIKARLYVSSNQPDTDFTVKLTDVYPDGRSMLITDGIVRMRNRNYNDQWEFMSPGTVYEVEVDLWSSSYVWNTGHQIRVAVSSSNYPRFLNNPNTIEGIHANMTYVLAHNTVYVDSMYPSALILPESASPAVSGAPVFNSMDVIDDDKKVVGEVVCEVVDPEGDDVYVLVSWGDGRYSGWMGPYASGKSISISHQYQKSGIYQIQVITKDVTGAHSAWMDSMSLPVRMNGAFQVAQLRELIKERLFQRLLS
ncbi:MAG: CocE/NonD family hydrolase, partial [Candidatus Thermoplasmatota archaeon]|nr:CocE/NonD family hydrolase [Candidatus Thermoplasmatota archaeon]MBU1940621.1 CocE/NonD family hydrolase [Candidatus Thermoplasmatota archaeon]